MKVADFMALTRGDILRYVGAEDGEDDYRVIADNKADILNRDGAVVGLKSPSEAHLYERPAGHPVRKPAAVKPGDYLANASSEARKGMPIATGVLDYFPDALAAVAEHSKAGNDKHNPGQPLHWARPKSTDHADCIIRHLASRGTRDKDGTRHSAGLAWRALALLQLEIEEEQSK